MTAKQLRAFLKRKSFKIAATTWIALCETWCNRMRSCIWPWMGWLPALSSISKGHGGTAVGRKEKLNGQCTMRTLKIFSKSKTET